MHVKDASMWAYPWDLQDEGVAGAIQKMHTAGIGDVKVASIYHSGRFLLPHNPRRKIYFPQPGALYFNPERSWYDTAPIQPPIWSELTEQFWPEVRTELDVRGQTLTTWCLGLHNSQVGSTHPEVAVRNAFGDVLMTDLCAANPAVIDLLKCAVGDAAQVTGADRVLLESFEYMPFQHGYHHEVIGVPVAPSTSLLLTLCFCSWCSSSAKKKDIDVDGLREWVRGRVNHDLANPFAGAKSLDWDRFRSGYGGELGRYWDLRNQAVDYLLTTVVNAIRAVSSARIGVLDFGPIYGTPVDGTRWQSGLDLTHLADIADEVHPTFYLADPQANKESIDSYLAVLPQGLPVHPAVRAILPQVHNATALQETIAPLQGKVDGLSFYNYGFVGEPAFEWIGQVVTDFQTRQGV
ncbi:hypothetical protein [Nesterenkonia sphaerica]|uniref:Uncharacterized protein n=1 Tax=Nesterenkonia sphaerica TaxID=1804988 RepID=A0A5R9AM36_9MICC|nr:hypothetical protein [Nesterenkonia sphaerica]TLP79881.1 hypothetical protein FEF27_00375 [Nesterenkonia sphaerica]